MKLGAFLRLSFFVVTGFAAGSLFQAVANAEVELQVVSSSSQPALAQNNLIQNFEQATANNSGGVVITDGRPFVDEGRLEVQKAPLQAQRKMFPINYEKPKETQHDD